MPNEFRETVEFKHGRIAENIILKGLQRRGWYILPTRDYRGEDEEDEKAPRLFGRDGSFILPDLFAFNPKDERVSRAWFECKAKSDPTWGWKAARWEHGISHRHCSHYNKVAAITGCPVYVIIVEGSTKDILVAKLSDLTGIDGKPTRYRQSVMKKRGRSEEMMLMFSREDFHFWDDLGNPGNKRSKTNPPRPPPEIERDHEKVKEWLRLWMREDRPS